VFPGSGIFTADAIRTSIRVITMFAKNKYIEINNRYINLKQNPFALVWLINFSNKNLRRLGFGNRLAGKYLLNAFKLKNKYPLLELPVYGNLCAPAHKAHLVFDFKRRAVFKVFDDDVAAKNILGEIELMKSISQFDFAVPIRRWDLEKRWYELEYVDGESGWSIAPNDPVIFMKNYMRYIAPCIKKMILFETPQATKISEYIKEIEESINWSELLNSELNTSKITSIKRFFESTIDQLKKEGDSVMQLVFSHGDFLPLNIIKTEKGISVIDWEHAGSRSLLHDLYNYFFTQKHWNFEMNLTSEIDDAIASLQNELSSNHKIDADSIMPISRLYRWLFYVERISLLFQRKWSAQALDVIFSSVYVFDRHESLLAGDHSQSQICYADYYKNKTAGEFYDFVVYNNCSYSSYLSKLEEQWLADRFRSLDKTIGGIKHLDFACGTGRIISAVEHISQQSTGIDISPEMISIAQTKVKKAKLEHGNILNEQNIVDFDYDVITAFRFFLNTEPEMRTLVMKSLSGRLRGHSSRLIFNMHGNENRPNLSVLLRKILRRKKETTQWAWVRQNYMTYREVRQFVKEAGLEIESWYGFGLCPIVWHRGVLKPVAKIIDRIAIRIPFLKALSENLLFVCKLKSNNL
jgi:SAM-dependent methyltransferase/aminoglycoside phosphotransferase